MVTVVSRGVARMGASPTLMGGSVDRAVEVVVGGAPAQGEAVDSAHKRLQVSLYSFMWRDVDCFSSPGFGGTNRR